MHHRLAYRSFPALLSVCFALGLLYSSKSAACSVPGPDEFELVPDAGDSVPPAAPTVRVAGLSRGKDEGDSGCSGDATSCDDIASVSLRVSPTEEGSSNEQLGYIVKTGDGETAAGYPDLPVQATDGLLKLHWSGDDGQSDVSFDVELWAVDRAGNVSTESTVVHVSSKGEGCRIASGRVGGEWLLLALALWLRPRIARLRRDKRANVLDRVS